MRSVFDGHISAALPVTVVEDSPERVVTWLRAGTPIRWLGVTPLPAWVDAGCPLLAKAWDDTNRLSIWPVGAHHSISFFWEAATGNEMSWYVDLLDPFVRTPLGWDTCDQELDIVAWPDLSAWWWKDEDRFAERIERGLLSREQADAVRREGERVIADLEARRRPFDEPWRAWRPDPEWPVPYLPEGWDVT